jgi:uncharacterized protein YbgA (DUF1722 family)
MKFWGQKTVKTKIPWTNPYDLMFVKSFFSPQISIEQKKNIQKFISDYNTQKANG